MQEKIRTMKNIHVLPTDKQSRLIIYSTLLNEFRLLDEPIEDWEHKKNIYITNSEEIKVGDWYYNPYTNQLQIKDIFDFGEDCKKIILTTNQDLIKDGVQAIDDEFLEWFVKNPSCERVETEIVEFGFDEVPICTYEIIIPKEEPKQETLEELAIQKRNELGLKGTIDGFIAGFEIAKERMYSDEEVSELVDMLQKCKEYFLLKTDLKSEERADAIGQVLEQFKKK